MEATESGTVVRLAHVSDLHLTPPAYRWQLGDWLNKRFTGWINLRWLGRGKRFRHSQTIVQKLIEELRERRPDCVVFSGDASSLGTDDELAHARELLGLGDVRSLPGLAVPGNHDYYVAASAQGAFEQNFAAWQTGERHNGHVYPFAQKVGHVWLIGVRSAVVNRWPWDASGLVDEDELRRLHDLVAALDDGPRILVTHYPVCRADGKLEAKPHRLRNVMEVTTTAENSGVGLWLHGHRHKPYHLQSTRFGSFPVICAGSATQEGLWSYGEYQISGNRLRAVRRGYDCELGQFRDLEAFELELA